MRKSRGGLVLKLHELAELRDTIWPDGKPTTVTVTTEQSDHELLPVNTAARVVTSPGVHYQPNIPASDQQLWITCPPLIPVPAEFRMRGKDLTGSRIDKLEIVGLLSFDTDRKHRPLLQSSLWVARCDCRRFVRRKYEPWRASKCRRIDRVLTGGAMNQCSVCKADARTRESLYYREHGVFPDGYLPNTDISFEQRFLPKGLYPEIPDAQAAD